MNISGLTRTYAVLGHPVKHSLSPVMHNAAFQALGRNSVYLAFDIEPERLKRVLRAMAGMGFGGVNVTVPLKEIAFRSMDDLDRSAELLGAVNTVEFLPTGLRGYNTDGIGFLKAIDAAFGVDPKGESVFVLGSGGAGRAVAITCAEKGASKVVLTDLKESRARKLALEMNKLFPSTACRAVPFSDAELGDACAGATLVVQATPMGMDKKDQPPLKAPMFSRGQMLFDLVYVHPETVTMREARKGDARTSNGLGMLLLQGAASFEIWTGIKPPVHLMRKALEKAVYKDHK